MEDGFDIIQLYLQDQIERNIKLIITDENMDYFNGSEAIKFIKNFEKLKNIDSLYIVSLSGNEDPNMKEYLKKCGATTCLDKPFSKNNFKTIIEDIIDDRNTLLNKPLKF